MEKAFDQSLIDWLPEFNQIKSANDSQQVLKVKKRLEDLFHLSHWK